MKHFYLSLLATVMLGLGSTSAQQVGPNILGAKGTFSAPFVTPKTPPKSTSPDYCVVAGTNSYNPVGNIGNPLSSLSGAGTAQPASGYDYVYKKDGLQPEFTYTLIKNIGDANGGNCIKGDWRAKDHTGDGGWFMAVNGAPNNSKSPIFYQIKDISVCPGTQYEFSAWVINLLPGTSGAAIPGSEPNISFRVTPNNGTPVVIANSGPIAYQNMPAWVKVTGTYTAPANATSVTLEVINATAVALGNDLGLDDISFNVKTSSILLSGDTGPACVGSTVNVTFTVNDATHTNSWYKWQVSKNGGASYTDSTAPAQATFTGDSYSMTLTIPNVKSSQNNYKVRLVAATSPSAFADPNCSQYVQDFTLIVTACGPQPVDLTAFNGKYVNGQVLLDWQTAQEVNSDKFEVYRSNDGQNFSFAGSVKSAGYSGITQNYSFTDEHPGSSQYVYYKLKQVDLDGKFIYTNIVKVAIGAKASLEVFPNPFTSSFTASFSANKTADATLIVRNSIGQPVMQKTIKAVKGNNSVNITNLPSLAPGVYYATIFNDDINYNFKLQKQ